MKIKKSIRFTAFVLLTSLCLMSAGEAAETGCQNIICDYEAAEKCSEGTQGDPVSDIMEGNAEENEQYEAADTDGISENIESADTDERSDAAEDTDNGGSAENTESTGAEKSSVSTEAADTEGSSVSTEGADAEESSVSTEGADTEGSSVSTEGADAEGSSVSAEGADIEGSSVSTEGADAEGSSASAESTDAGNLSECRDGIDESKETENAEDCKDSEMSEQTRGSDETRNEEPEIENEEEIKEDIESYMAESGLDFSSMRLIVAADNEQLLADYPVISSYEGLYILQFDSEEDTCRAYIKLCAALAFVEPDGKITAADESDIEAEPGEDQPAEEIMSPDDNPFEELKDALSQNDSSADYDIALIDTGASGENIISAVSMIGESTDDDNGHGSKMAELIREQNPDVKILSIKAFDENGRADISAVYAAFEYAVSLNVRIINLSASARALPENELLREAVIKASRQGITVVGAAGNNGRDAGYYVPASIDEAVIAGACNENGERLSISNFGTTVDYNVFTDSTSKAAAILSGIISLKGLSAVQEELNKGLIFETTYEQDDETEEPGSDTDFETAVTAYVYEVDGFDYYNASGNIATMHKFIADGYSTELFCIEQQKDFVDGYMTTVDAVSGGYMTQEQVNFLALGKWYLDHYASWTGYLTEDELHFMYQIFTWIFSPTSTGSASKRWSVNSTFDYYEDIFLTDMLAIKKGTSSIITPLAKGKIKVLVPAESSSQMCMYITYSYSFDAQATLTKSSSSTASYQLVSNNMYTQNFSGTKFSVTVKKITTGKSTTKTYITDSSGTVTITGLTAGDVITVTETAAPTGYLLSSNSSNLTKSLTINAGSDNGLKFTDEPEFDGDGSINIKKVLYSEGELKTAEVIEGAVFKMDYYDNLNCSSTPVRSWYFVTDADGIIKYDAAYLAAGYTSSSLYKNASGKYRLPLGSVKVTEVYVPAAYSMYDYTVRGTISHDTAKKTAVMTWMSADENDQVKISGSSLIFGNAGSIALPVTGSSSAIKMFMAGIVIILMSAGYFLKKKGARSGLLLGVIVLMASMSFVTSVYAQGQIAVISKSDESHDYEAYLLLSAVNEGDGVLSDVSFPKGIDPELLERMGFNDERKTAVDFCEWLSENAAADSSGAWTVHMAEALLADDDIQAYASWDSDETVTLPDGYYLIMSDDAQPFMAAVGNNECLTIYEKSISPVLKKEVGEITYEADKETIVWSDAADTGLGDRIPYRLTGTLPSNYNAYDSYSYNFRDSYEDGIEAELSSVRVYILEQGSQNEKDITEGARIYIDDNCLNIEFDDLTKVYPEYKKDDLIIVEYDAYINENASLGSDPNDNTAYIEYSRSPTNMSLAKSKNSRCRVYTWQLNVYKADKESKEGLEGAQFTIRDSRGRYVNTDGSRSESLTDESVWTSDQYGKFTVQRIDSGAYLIKEIEAPEGYTGGISSELLLEADYEDESKLKLDLTVKGDDSETGSVKAEEGLAVIKLENEKLPPNPHTADESKRYLWTALIIVSAVILSLAAKKILEPEKGGYND